MKQNAAKCILFLRFSLTLSLALHFAYQIAQNQKWNKSKMGKIAKYEQTHENKEANAIYLYRVQPNTNIKKEFSINEIRLKYNPFLLNFAVEKVFFAFCTLLAFLNSSILLFSFQFLLVVMQERRKQKKAQMHKRSQKR